ncbi:hypothetical protein ACTJKQ_04060 [Acidovorax sp. 22279]|uniref:hypothetical protein n=1 Tax=Acidovorax sp. 22279 TaxID=3453900 RepID=UPI003F841C94
MARLVPFSLQSGQRIDVDGVPHRISKVAPSSPIIVLVRADGSGIELQTTRNELATLVVTERAEFLDELDDPEHDPSRQFSDISHLTVQRMLDWQAKLFLLRAMLPYAGRSPKSRVFRSAFDGALEELNDWYRSMGMDVGSGWSPWTLYHDMLNWRAARFEISALQSKGVEYRPWTTRSALYEVAIEIATEIKQRQPNLSALGVHRRTNQRMARKKSVLGGEFNEKLQDTA